MRPKYEYWIHDWLPAWLAVTATACYIDQPMPWYLALGCIAVVAAQVIWARRYIRHLHNEYFKIRGYRANFTVYKDFALTQHFWSRYIGEGERRLVGYFGDRL
jgi:hypothetical protein